MLTEELRYLIIDPEGRPVAAYPDLKTAELDAEDLTKDLPNKVVHIFELQNSLSLGTKPQFGSCEFLQLIFKHYRSYPMPPEEMPKIAEPEVEPQTSDETTPQDEAKVSETIIQKVKEEEIVTEQLKCSICGALQPAGAMVCVNCGTKISESDSGEVNVSQASPPNASALSGSKSSNDHEKGTNSVLGQAPSLKPEPEPECKTSEKDVNSDRDFAKKKSRKKA